MAADQFTRGRARCPADASIDDMTSEARPRAAIRSLTGAFEEPGCRLGETLATVRRITYSDCGLFVHGPRPELLSLARVATSSRIWWSTFVNLLEMVLRV